MRLFHDSATVPTLRVITDLNSTLTHHCSFCNFFHGANDEHCQPRQRRRLPSRTSSSQQSDGSLHSMHAPVSADARTSTTSVKAKIKPLRRADSPTLRHKLSPTKTSLRDLQQQQSQQAAMRMVSSDERLREIYEAQILMYLGGSYATLDRVEE